LFADCRHYWKHQRCGLDADTAAMNEAADQALAKP